tara:strand:- start:1101 stop:1355 length:255 start_codon:yes stop_codon:yes gene_type:complete
LINLKHKPSVKIKGAELYVRVGKPNIRIMNEKYITDNFSFEDLPIWVERSNWWYIVADGKVFEKRRTLKQSQEVVRQIIDHDLI